MKGEFSKEIKVDESTEHLWIYNGQVWIRAPEGTLAKKVREIVQIDDYMGVKELFVFRDIRLKMLHMFEEARRDFYSVIQRGYVDNQGNLVRIKPYINSTDAIEKIEKWFGSGDENVSV